MAAKTHQLQVRVTAKEKALLKRHALAAGMDVSSYVLARALPSLPDTFGALLRRLRSGQESRFVLAELNDFLYGCPPTELATATARSDVAGLPLLLQNYVAAMVEQAAEQKSQSPPTWVADIPPLAEPFFTTTLVNLRLHLLQASPVPFKRRNIFIDSGVGARV